jgi:hypothetical protein
MLGLALTILPWLHTRYAFLAVTSALIICARIVRPRVERLAMADVIRRLGAFLIVPAVGGALWLWFFRAIYGTFDPRAPYGGATDVHLARIPHGLAGLFLDQQFGLLPNAPIYLIALGGLVTLWRVRRRLAFELIVLVMPYVLAVAAFHMWWAGHSTPARFLVPVLMPAAISVAAWWKRHDSRVPRLVATTLVAASVALTVVLAVVRSGALAYNTRDGFAAWLDLAAPSVGLATALPSLFQTGVSGAVSLALAWMFVWSVAWIVLRALSRRIASRGPWLLFTGIVIALGTVAGASLAWTLSGGQPLEPGSSAVALAARACRGDGVGLAVAKAEPMAVRAVVAELVIPEGWRRPLPGGGQLWASHDLPPGQYAVRLDSGVAATGTLTVAVGRPDQPLLRCALDDARPGRTGCRIDLPAGAEALWISGDPNLLKSAPRISLEAISLGPPANCGLHAGRAIASASHVLFVVSGRVFAEGAGAWVEGGQDGMFIGRPDGRELRLRVRNGPMPNQVRVSSGAWHEDLSLQSGEARDVAVPALAVTDPIPVTVRPRRGFRPADADRTSHDVRWLGVWVQPG